MDRVRLGKTGMLVSRVGFGGLPMQRLGEWEGVSLVKRCLEMGVNFFDTAYSYTGSEAAIGRGIKGRRESVFLATGTMALDVPTLSQHLHESLERLGVSYVDLYQLQDILKMDVYRQIIQPGEALSFLQDARVRGLIRHIGIAAHAMDVAREAAASGLFEVVMYHFNFVSDEARDELIPLCQQHDVGFIASKPLAGGFIEYGTLAFKYLKQFPSVVPIPGIEKPVEMEQILQALSDPGELTEAEKARIAEIRSALGTRYCRRCGHCLPCEQEVQISLALNVDSGFKRFAVKDFFGGYYSRAVDSVANCTECGTCEEKCAFFLPIRSMLKENVALFQRLKADYERARLEAGGSIP